MRITSFSVIVHRSHLLRCSASALALGLVLASGGRAAAQALAVPTGFYDLGTRQESYTTLTVSGDGFINSGVGSALTVQDGTVAGIVPSTSALRGGLHLIKNGPGTLDLQTSNSYAGGTTINGGTVIMGHFNALGSGTITLNGGTVAVRNTGAFGGSGPTMTDDVVLGAGGGTFGLALLDNGNVAGSVRFARAITGIGGLTITGESEFNFAHLEVQSTYQGATRISNASILLENVENLLPANTALTVENGGVLDIVDPTADDVEFRQTIGSLSGDGKVRLDGGGGRNSRLIVGQNGQSTTFSGVLESGAPDVVEKIGAGTLTLTGDSSGLYLGALQVTGGGLIVDGNLRDAAVTVGSATFGGRGTVRALTLGAGSTYQVTVGATPHATNDGITVTGAANLGNAGVSVLRSGADNTYTVGTRYTILMAQGGLNGTFSGVKSANFAFVTPILSYEANKVSMTLEQKTTPLPPPTTPTNPTNPATPTDPATPVDPAGPDIPGGPITPTGPGQPIHFSSVAHTSNQWAAGTSIQSVGTGRVYNSVLLLTADEAREAFDALSGEAHTAVPTLALNDSDLVRRAILERLRSSPSRRGLPAFVAANTATAYAAGKAARVAPVPVPRQSWNVNLWGQAFGNFGRVASDGNAARLDRNTGGFVAGIDTAFGESWRAGFAGAYTTTSFDIPGRMSSGSLESWHLAAYGSTSIGGVNLRGGALYAHNDADVKRASVFPGFSGATEAGYGGDSLNLFGEVGYGVAFGAFAMEPYLGLNHFRFDSEVFAEGGAESALRGAGTSYDQTYSSLGLRISTVLPVGSGALSAKAGLSWRHAFMETAPLATLQFAGGGLPFTVSGVPADRNSLAVETGLDWAVSPAVTLGVKYDGAFGHRAQDHAVKGNFSIRF